MVCDGRTGWMMMMMMMGVFRDECKGFRRVLRYQMMGQGR
jgi:hypothetical protein